MGWKLGDTIFIGHKTTEIWSRSLDLMKSQCSKNNPYLDRNILIVFEVIQQLVIGIEQIWNW